jgi:hypothetical protein
LFWLVIGNLARECRVFATPSQKNGQIMQKYFDRDRKLYQIAWQPSKGGVRLAMQR